MDKKLSLRNFGKLAGMGVLGVVGAGTFVFALVWPMLLWWQFGQPLAVAVAITIVWITANL